MVYSRMSIAFPRKYYYVPNVRRHLSHFARWLTFWYHTGNSYAWISSFAQQAFRADLLPRPLKIYCGLIACVYWKGETLKSRYFYAIKCLFSIVVTNCLLWQVTTVGFLIFYLKLLQIEFNTIFLMTPLNHRGRLPSLSFDDLVWHDAYIEKTMQQIIIFIFFLNHYLLFHF